MANERVSIHAPNLQTRRGSYSDEKTHAEISSLMRELKKEMQRHADAINDHESRIEALEP